MTSGTSEVIRLVVADDHAIVREGIRSYLASRPGIQVVGETSDGYRAIEITRSHLPHILIADITMPGMSGLDVVRRLSSLAPQVRVLILTMHEDEGCLAEAIRAGAGGYVLKDTGPEDLLTAIRRVHAGEPFVTDRRTRVLLDRAQRGATLGSRPFPRGLSRREREVLSCLVEGMTSKEIALRLKLSARTVECHRARLKSRLGLRSSADLVKYALARGLHPPR